MAVALQKRPRHAPKPLEVIDFRHPSWSHPASPPPGCRPTPAALLPVPRRAGRATACGDPQVQNESATPAGCLKQARRLPRAACANSIARCFPKLEFQHVSQSSVLREILPW